MPDRRAFLTAVVTTSAAASLLPAGAEAQSASPAPSPSPQASGSPAPKPPSAAAAAIAASMRAYDPALTDDELMTIARAIDDGRKAGERLNPKGRLLRNGDEPVTRFHA